MDVGELHLFSTEETTVCHRESLYSSWHWLPSCSCHCLPHIWHDTCNGCFLAIDLPAIENNIFTSKQSFSAKHAGMVVSVLTMIPDPVTDQESVLVS